MKVFGHITRRDLVGGAAALGLVSAFGQPVHAQQRIRRSVTRHDFDPTTLDAYKRAIHEMLRLPPSNPHNWYRQAIIHLVDCPHQNWWFLPWHRGYLYHFEQICRKWSGDETFALPFWDWTEVPRVPDVFFDDVLDPRHEEYEASFNKFRVKFQDAIRSFWDGLNDQQKDDLSHRRGRVGPNEEANITSPDVIVQCIDFCFALVARRPRLTRDEPSLPGRDAIEVSSERIRQALVFSRFEDVGSGQAARPSDHSDNVSSLEGGPHDHVHDGVRGFMGWFMSPTDPLFWLHHANLDRIWMLWKRQRADPKSGDPEHSDVWRRQPFRFFSDVNGQPLSDAKADDYIEMEPLGYSYGPGFDPSIPAKPVMALRPLARFASKEASVPLQTFAETSLSVTVPAGRITPPSPGESLIAVTLWFLEVSVVPPSNVTDYHVLVFVNCPYLAADTPITDPHYVGGISFFGAGHGHEVTYSLPLSPALSRLEAIGRPAPEEVKVQLLTIDDTGQVRKTLDGALKKVSIREV